MSNLRPAGHHTITPRFIVPSVTKVIDFLEKAFDAKVVDRYDGPNGALMHAEVLIGDSIVTCGEPMPRAVGPGGLLRAAVSQPMPGAFSFYVADEDAVDATFKRALAAGAKVIDEPRNWPWGYRSTTVVDPGGNWWTICAVVEIVTHDEIQRRLADMMKR